MKIFVCDAFASKIFSGNQAGVVLIDNDENFPVEDLMKNISAELKHSETAFVKKVDEKNIKLDILHLVRKSSFVVTQRSRYFLA